jgi:hypothetical protein
MRIRQVFHGRADIRAYDFTISCLALQPVGAVRPFAERERRH